MDGTGITVGLIICLLASLLRKLRNGTGNHRTKGDAKPISHGYGENATHFQAAICEPNPHSYLAGNHCHCSVLLNSQKLKYAELLCEY